MGSRFTTKITNGKHKSYNNMSDTTIAILSAGSGSRIKSHEPRSLIKIGNKTLIEHQLSTIRDCFESPDIIAVVGCKAEKIIKKMRGDVRIVENQIHDATNTSESIRLAFNNGLKKNFLFMHGDLYFNTSTLKNVDYSKSFVIIDNKDMILNKEVGLTVFDDTATIFSYGLSTKWCQIAYVTGKEMKILKNIFNKFDHTHKKMLSFEILNKMISMGAKFKCYEPADMSILEIDRIKDLK
jgi:NDP-sugar pyrophosphorylase family protein|tara:strand:+ start:4240 stop:4956 length:717 start_codon:yes stop_codon:yes gene_type:complete